MEQTISTFSRYLSLVKFSHTIFAMPFAIIGFFLATQYYGYPFSWQKLILVVLCMVFARNAAMGFNRYIDRDIDQLNPRTAIREIPAGAISPHSALVFVVVNCALFCISTYFINPLCFALSPIALTVVLGYSYTKRFTALCHMVLGLGLSLAPIGAFLAVSGEFRLLPLFYSGVVLFWVSGFDIIYALQDENFDRQQSLHAIPVWLGTRRALGLARVLHFCSAALVVLAGIYAGFGGFYAVGAALFIGLLVFQHTLVKPNDLSRVNLAFFTTNGFASLIFAVFTLLELFMSK